MSFRKKEKKVKVKAGRLSFPFHHLILSLLLACARVFSCETSVRGKCYSSPVGFKSQYCKLSEPNQTLRGCCDVPAAKLPEMPEPVPSQPLVVRSQDQVMRVGLLFA